MTTRQAVGVAFLGLIVSQAGAQTTIDVNAGQTLSESDLDAGLFDGQGFALGPSTTFEINDGGTLAALGDHPDTTTRIAYDLAGSTVNLNDGSFAASYYVDADDYMLSTISGVTINLYPGGYTGDSIEIRGGSVLNVLGGALGYHTTVADGSVINFSSGTTLYSGYELRLRSGAEFHAIGGIVDAPVDAAGAAFVFVNECTLLQTLDVDGGACVIADATVSTTYVENATLTMTNATVLANGVTVRSNAHADMSGGYVDGAVTVGDPGSSLTMTSGGAKILRVLADGSASVSGGYFGSSFSVRSGGACEFTGGEFLLNGAPTGDIPGGLASGDVLTGTLADGTPIIITQFSSGDDIDGALTLVEVPLPPIDTTPQVLTTGEYPAHGLRAGQSLTISGDAVVPATFDVVDASLIVEGGTVGEYLVLARSLLDVSGGTIDNTVKLADGSDALVSGGAVAGLRAHDDSTASISGGTIYGAEAQAGGTINITGGVLQQVIARPLGSVNISGGSVGDYTRVFDGATMNFDVLAASVDGVPLALTPGVPHEVAERDEKMLAMTLADGSAFEFVLDTGFDADHAGDDATLTVTLVPGGCPADIDADGDADPDDIAAFVDLFIGAGLADIDNDGDEDPDDIQAFVDAFIAGC